MTEQQPTIKELETMIKLEVENYKALEQERNKLQTSFLQTEGAMNYIVKKVEMYQARIKEMSEITEEPKEEEIDS